MKQVLFIYAVGLVIFVAAFLWNAVCKKLGIVTAYDLLTKAKRPKTFDIVFLVIMYPLVLGGSAVLALLVLAGLFGSL